MRCAAVSLLRITICNSTAPDRIPAQVPMRVRERASGRACGDITDLCPSYAIRRSALRAGPPGLIMVPTRPTARALANRNLLFRCMARWVRTLKDRFRGWRVGLAQASPGWQGDGSAFPRRRPFLGAAWRLKVTLSNRSVEIISCDDLLRLFGPRSTTDRASSALQRL